ncbi:MAG: YwmB family TATA-box binding protein [Bacillaceae bacterium]|nr:YwmB family TATA-box binding protein [Bacillaceae bacterium]
MNQKTWLQHGVLLLIFLTGFSMLAMAKQSDIEQHHELTQRLIRAVEDTGAVVQKVQYHQGIPMEPVTQIDALMDLGKEWASGWETENIRLDQDKTGEHPYVRVRFIKQGVSVDLNLTGTRHGNQWIPYLVIRVEAPADRLEQARQITSRLSERLGEKGLMVKINTCLQAVYNAKLNHHARINMINQVIHSFDAHVVEKMEDNVVQSYSAYSPHIPQFIYTKDVKMNLQVATHVDPDKRLTRLTVGTPIITTTY